MEGIRRWLIPNQFDGIMALIVLALAPGMIYSAIRMMSIGNVGVFLLLAVPALITIAAAACVGWWNFGRWRLILLFAACVISFLLPQAINGVFGWDASMINGVNHWDFWYGKNYVLEMQDSYLDWTSWSALVTAAGFVVVAAIVAFLRLIPVAAINKLTSFRKKTKHQTEFPRTKVLIFSAVFLFVMALVNNALVASGFNVLGGDVMGMQGITEIALGAGFYLLAFLILVFWPSWAVLRNEQFWIKMAGVGTLVVPALAYLVLSLSSLSNAGKVPHLAIASSVVFLVVVFVATIFCLKRVNQESVYPSVWSLVPLIFGGMIYLSPSFYDFGQLMVPSYSNFDIKERVTAGLQSGRTMWKSNGRVSGANGAYSVRFDADTSPDILNTISFNNKPKAGSWMPTNSLMISGIAPELDTSPLLKKRIAMVGVVGGKMSLKQVKDIVCSASHVFFKDVKLEPGELNISQNPSSMIHLQMNEPGGVGKFLKSIENCKGVSGFNIQTRIANEDWPEILRISQSCPVSLAGGLPQNFTSYTDNPNNLSAKNISVDLHSIQSNFVGQNDMQDIDQTRFIFETDVRVTIQFFYSQQQLFWDLAFAKPERVNFNNYSFQVPIDNEALLHRFHLVYGKNESGSITDLYLPKGFGVIPISKPENLQSLSFDYEWLTNEPSMALSGTVVQELGFLKAYANLTELYIPDCQLDINNLDFLSKLTKLRHLQIPAVDRSTIVSGGFDDLESLESIRFMGKPDKKSLQELQGLPNLKRLEIVDVLNDYSDQKKAKRLLEKIFPGADIGVFPPTEYKPDIPEKFTEHLNKSRQLVLEKLDLSELE